MHRSSKMTCFFQIIIFNTYPVTDSDQQYYSKITYQQRLFRIAKKDLLLVFNFPVKIIACIYLALVFSSKLSPGPHKLVVTIDGVGGPIKGVDDVPSGVADTAATATASVTGSRQAGDHKQQHKSQHGWLVSD